MLIEKVVQSQNTIPTDGFFALVLLGPRSGVVGCDWSFPCLGVVLLWDRLVHLLQVTEFSIFQVSRKDVSYVVLRGLIVVEVVVLFQKDLDRQFIACNLLLVSSKSIAKSIGDWIRSKSIVDLVASFLVICHELQFVLVVALNLVLVAIEMVVRVVDIVSSLLL